MSGEVHVGYQKKFLFRSSGDALAQAAQRVVESPSLEVFRDHGDVALRDVVKDGVMEMFVCSNLLHIQTVPAVLFCSSFTDIHEHPSSEDRDTKMQPSAGYPGAVRLVLLFCCVKYNLQCFPTIFRHY